MEERVVLITGAAKRVGRVVAMHLHHAGAKLIIHYGASKSDAMALVDTLNAARQDSAVCLQADLCDLQTVKQLGQDALAVWGKVDVLINNASSFYPTPLDKATDVDWQKLMMPNVQAPYFLCQALAPSLKSQQGVIVNMADIHAERPLKDHSIYTMAKAAVIAMTRSLAKDLAPEVRVNAIAPGMVLWPDDHDFSEKTQQAILNRIPLKRAGTPEHIASAIAFLIQNDYITGHILPIDGGRSI
jgi:pteridine reductase